MQRLLKKMLKSRQVIGGAEIDSKVRSLRRCRLIDCRCCLRGTVVSVKPVSGGGGSLETCRPFVEYRNEQNGGGLVVTGLTGLETRPSWRLGATNLLLLLCRSTSYSSGSVSVMISSEQCSHAHSALGLWILVEHRHNSYTDCDYCHNSTDWTTVVHQISTAVALDRKGVGRL
jgi:hypothetical protein